MISSYDPFSWLQEYIVILIIILLLVYIVILLYNIYKIEMKLYLLKTKKKKMLIYKLLWTVNFLEFIKFFNNTYLFKRQEMPCLGRKNISYRTRINWERVIFLVYEFHQIKKYKHYWLYSICIVRMWKNRDQ